MQLGVLPLGTLNHFARDAGIPLDLEEAVAAIAGGRTRQVDVAEVNGRIFINNSAVGLYPELVEIARGAAAAARAEQEAGDAGRRHARLLALLAPAADRSASPAMREASSRLCCSSATIATR